MNIDKTTFRGRVFMTHPTKAIYKWLLSDYVKVSNISVEDMLYDEQDLLRSFDRIEVIDFHQETDIDGVRFTAYNAGHVLGAAMFVIEIAGVKVLYTGDYSREEDRHLMAAERPPGLVPDVMICESTYGVQSNEPRPAREARFTGRIEYELHYCDSELHKCDSRFNFSPPCKVSSMRLCDEAGAVSSLHSHSGALKSSC